MSSHDEDVTDSGVADRLLAFVRRKGYRPVPQRELFHRMHLAPDEREVARSAVERLVAEGRLVRIRGGRLAAGAEGELRGRLRRSGSGFAVVGATRAERVFVAEKHAADAADGDDVVVEILGRRRNGDLRAKVVRTLPRRPRMRIGLYFKRGRLGYVRPFHPGDGDPLHVPAQERGGAEDGDVVHWSRREGGKRFSRQASVVDVMGRFEDPAIDTRIVIAEHGLPEEFPEGLLREAEEIVARRRKEGGDRERFDDPAPVTIDGETAQDFDDAIAVSRRERGGYRLFVHIADVAHFVRPGEAIDTEAVERGTSVYFPDRVLPMLPEVLSNDACSLRPHEERLVQSAVIDFDRDGKPVSVRFADGRIRSRARLTYAQVAEALDVGKPTAGMDAEVFEMLACADELRVLLERVRQGRGSIDFDLPEPMILLDVEGAMTGVTIAPRNRAHRMIEEFMIAANEAVARRLDAAEAPALYRIHEPPDPAKVEVLAGFAKRLGVSMAGKEGAPTPKDFQRLLEVVADRPESEAVSHVALRTMSQARYVPRNEGHFGLASESYCHFTSPIRRYPDLVVHRSLRTLRHGGAPGIEGEALEDVGVRCSSLERRAEAAERQVLLRKKLRFIAGRVGDEADGVVTGVARFGVFVRLVESRAEGLVRVETLGEEYFEFDEGLLQLVGRESGKRYGFGDAVRVRIDRVDLALQRADFSIAGAGPGRLRRRRRRR